MMLAHEAGSDRDDALARALAARLRDAAEAADRLAEFSFDQRWDVPLASTICDGDETAVAHDFVLRVLAGAVEPVNHRMLQLIVTSETGARPDALMQDSGLTRMAVIERVHALIQLGLVARDLQADTVCATPAGRGMVEYVEQLESDVAQWLCKRRRR